MKCQTKIQELVFHCFVAACYNYLIRQAADNKRQCRLCLFLHFACKNCMNRLAASDKEIALHPLHVNKQIPVGTYTRTHITHLPAWVNHVNGTCCTLEVMRTNTGFFICRGGLFRLYRTVALSVPYIRRFWKFEFYYLRLIGPAAQRQRAFFLFLFNLWHGPLHCQNL